MVVENESLLAELLASCGAAAPTDLRELTGRGSDNKVLLVTLEDTTQVILRRRPAPDVAEDARDRLLQRCGVAAPRVLASSELGSLVEYVPGDLLGDLIERGVDTAETWHKVADAYRSVHSVRFPAGLVGDIAPDGMWLTPRHRTADHLLTDKLQDAEPRLRERGLEGDVPLSRVRDIVARCGPALDDAPSSLGHGDINMWNIIVGDEYAWLIDWDNARVVDPALEIALLDKHAHLFNGVGLPSSFFERYGPRVEPATSVHRVVETIAWVVSDDWEEFGTAEDIPEELRARAVGWLRTMVEYLRETPARLDRIELML